jgi:iron complex transport system permease protein
LADPTSPSLPASPPSLVRLPAPRGRLVYPMLIALLALSAAAALLLGHGDLGDARLRDALLELRLGRLAAAFLTGASLAVAGVVVQGLFRNPLADPALLGATAGASFGGQAAMMLSQRLLAGQLSLSLAPLVFLPIGCLLGGLLALAILLAIARRHGDLVLLLLTGFILSSMFLGLGNFLMSMAQEKWELGRAMVAFVLGGLSGTSAAQVAMAWPLVLGGVVAAWLWGRPLDVLQSGEDESASLGVDVRAVRRWGVVWSATLTGAAVSLGGNVGFVGLIVPHALRALLGSEHRRLVPAAALGGGAFVIACDVLARVVPARTELPLGVVTGLIGAPVFLLLLLRTWRAGEHG